MLRSGVFCQPCDGTGGYVPSVSSAAQNEIISLLLFVLGRRHF